MVPEDQLEQIAGNLEEDLRLRLQQVRVDREILRSGLDAALAELPTPEPAPAVQDTTPLLRSLAAIDAADSQKGVLDALVGELAGRVECCALIIYRFGKATAWHGPGFGLGEGEELGSKQTEIWPAGDSLTERSRSEGRALVSEGELSSGDWKVIDALEGSRPAQLAAIPMIVRGKAQAVVLVGGASIADPGALALLVNHAAVCVDLQRIRAKNGHIALLPPKSVTAAPAPEPEVEPAGPVEIEPPIVIEEPAAVEISEEPVVVEEPEVVEEPVTIEEPVILDEPTAEEQPLELVIEEEPAEAPAEEEPAEPEVAAGPEFELAEVAPPEEEEVELVLPTDEPAGEEPAEEEAEIEIVAEEPAAPEPAAPVVELEGYDLSGFGDEEREAHEKAIRFARLLVSEIKLYNEDAVRLGRENKDLKNRLQDDIERSRSLYNERIPEDVRSHRDYLRGELVRQLAEGDESLLG